MCGPRLKVCSIFELDSIVHSNNSSSSAYNAQGCMLLVTVPRTWSAAALTKYSLCRRTVVFRLFQKRGKVGLHCGAKMFMATRYEQKNLPVCVFAASAHKPGNYWLPVSLLIGAAGLSNGAWVGLLKPRGILSIPHPRPSPSFWVTTISRYFFDAVSHAAFLTRCI